jgi:hypothetical protein
VDEGQAVALAYTKMSGSSKRPEPGFDEGFGVWRRRTAGNWERGQFWGNYSQCSVSPASKRSAPVHVISTNILSTDDPQPL